MCFYIVVLNQSQDKKAAHTHLCQTRVEKCILAMSNNMLTFHLVVFIGAQVTILFYPKPTIKERHSHSDVGTDDVGLLIKTVSFSKVLADL